MSKWQFDPMHTQVEFSAKHLGMMTVRGTFNDVTTEANLDPEHPEKSSFSATIKTESIRTHNEQRDRDLRSSYFLEIDKYPTMSFKSTKIEHLGGDKFKVTGDLTIKDVTKPVTLDVFRYGEMNDDQMGHRIGYAAQTEINRKDFGMHFDAARDGRFIVSNEIQISIEGEVVEVKEQAAAASA
jgi:polyisoprenoid-binding protein YceI